MHLATNRGKALALNAGAIAARHEILVAIDGDSLLDRDAVTWFVRRFLSDGTLGALTGNPRIRNRSSLLARLQVGEYSAIVGLIKRAQTLFGCVFTVSGVVCAFRKRALHDGGWWSPATLTDDVDMTWRIQMAGWTVAYEPKALCWILMPETLRGLWRQRLRWSEGGTQTVLRLTPQMFHRRLWRLWIVWFNYMLSVLWAYAMLAGLLVWCLRWTSLAPLVHYPAFSPVPQGWGALLTVTYLLQASVSLLLDHRFEQGILRVIFWQAWYPLFFWVLQALTAVVGVPRAILPPDADLHRHVGEPGSRRAMKTGRPPVEPPIIRTRVPAWMQVRDVLLTLGAWLLIGYFLREGLYLAYDYFRAPIFELTTATAPDWGEMWGRLRGFVLLAAALVAWITFWALDSRARLQATHSPQPRAAARLQPRRARRVERGGAGRLAPGEGADRGHRSRAAGHHAGGWAHVGRALGPIETLAPPHDFAAIL